MATVNEAAIVPGASGLDLAKASAKLYVEMTEIDYVFSTLKQLGAINHINDLSKDSLAQGSGTTVYAYDRPRFSGKGRLGDSDAYSNAQQGDIGSRSLDIRLISESLTYKLKGTEAQQVASFNLKEGLPRQAADWCKSYTLAWLLNQAGGNTATSITNPAVSDESFTTTAELKMICGNNTAIAPSSLYKAIGAEGVGGITTDEGIDSDNRLKLVDFMNAREVINSLSAGVPKWDTLGTTFMGHYIEAAAIVGTTGMNQLKNDAVTTGQGINFAQLQYAKMAGGKEFAVGRGMYVMENILFVEVPDYLVPTGVNSSTAAAVANTRRAIILGREAVDLAFGRGYDTGGGNGIAGVSVEIDEEHKKLNNRGTLKMSLFGGAKKRQQTGTGSLASTAYDKATFVISHYA